MISSLSSALLAFFGALELQPRSSICSVARLDLYVPGSGPDMSALVPTAADRALCHATAQMCHAVAQGKVDKYFNDLYLQFVRLSFESLAVLVNNLFDKMARVEFGSAYAVRRQILIDWQRL